MRSILLLFVALLFGNQVTLGQPVNLNPDSFIIVNPFIQQDSTTVYEKFDVPTGEKRLLVIMTDLSGRSDLIADATINGVPLTTFIYNPRNGSHPEMGNVGGAPIAGGGHQLWYHTVGSGAALPECLIAMTRRYDPSSTSPANSLPALRVMVFQNVDQDNPIGQVEFTNDTYIGGNTGGVSYNFNLATDDRVVSINNFGATIQACLQGHGIPGFDSIVHNQIIFEGTCGSGIMGSISGAASGTICVEWWWYQGGTSDPLLNVPFINEAFQIRGCPTGGGSGGGGSSSTEVQFVVDGTENNTANAFTVLKNGDVSINGAYSDGQLNIKQNTGGSQSGLRLIAAASNHSWELGNAGKDNNLRIRAYGNDPFFAEQTIEISRHDGSYNIHSDRRLKTNITYLNHELDKIISLKPASYDWKNRSKIGSKSVGIIAQDVEILFPEIVTTNDHGYKMVNYDAFGVLAIQAIKELNMKIESQEKEVAMLRNMIIKLKEKMER